MSEEICMSLIRPKNEQNYFEGLQDGQNKNTFVQDIKKHVTPDNLSKKLKLHRKTELSEFFQAKKSRYCDVFK